MIEREYYKTREDGVELFLTFSDADMMIRKVSTNEVYAKAIDIENSGFTYTETDIPIEEDTGELTVDDTLAMLNELGVDIDDH